MNIATNTDKLLAHKDGAAGWVTFNNPAKRNAMSYDMWLGLDLALDDALEGAGAEGRVEALPGQLGHRTVVDVERDATIRQALDEVTGPVQALKDIDLDFPAGQLTSLLRAKLANPHIHSICKTDGLSYKVREIVAGIERIKAEA